MEHKFNGLEVILECGRAKISASDSQLDEVTLKKLVNTLRKYILGELTFQQSYDIFQATTGYTYPLSYIAEIVEEVSKPAIRSIYELDGTKKQCHWTYREDVRLLAGILQWGERDWSKIGTFIGNCRSRSQCIQRWSRTINPLIKKDVWTKQEDEKLLSLVGTTFVPNISWKDISTKMKNRSDVQCRYRYNQLIKRQDGNARQTKRQSLTKIPSIYQALNDEHTKSALASIPMNLTNFLGCFN